MPHLERTTIPCWMWLLVCGVIITQVIVITCAQWQTPPTYDEQNHVTRGIAIVRTGDYRLSLHHPPVANILEALPVAGLHHDGFTTAVPSWQTLAIWPAAHETIWTHPQQGIRLIKYARLSVILFVVMLALVIFLWATDLFGPCGGLLSLLLCTLDPNILAHGGLATTDIPAASTILLALYLLYRYQQRATWVGLVIAGVGIGIACATKYSGLVLLPIAVVLLLLQVARTPHDGVRGMTRLRSWGVLFQRAAGLLFVAGFVVWGIYGFSVEPYGSKPGQRISMNASRLERFPVPAMQYFRGLHTVTMEKDRHNAYLMGNTSRWGTSWWYYGFVVIATKTPLPALLIFLGALGCLMLSSFRKCLSLPTATLCFLVLPIGIYLVAAIASASLNQGIRHLLPIYPFLMILAGSLVHLPRKAFILPIVSGLLLWQLASIGRVYPDFLAYFNELAGGPMHGYRVLAGPNCDWGQDIERLAIWQRTHDIPEIALSYYGSTPPEAYGLHYRPLVGMGYLLKRGEPLDLTHYHGYVAISVTNLVSAPWISGVDYRWLQAKQPYARVGHTIIIYKLSLQSL